MNCLSYKITIKPKKEQILIQISETKEMVLFFIYVILQRYEARIFNIVSNHVVFMLLWANNDSSTATKI